MWQRRAFLKAAGAGFAATLLPQRAEALESAELLFATATQESPGRFGARVLTETGKLISAVDLPVRGHDVTYSREAGRAVVFARQPGMFAVVFDPAGKAPSITIPSIEGRHFFGHGVFSPDGTLLYATENDFANARGVIAIYDVASGYKRVDEFDTYGTGPHEMILMPDGKSFAVANGGIETHPDYGRTELNLDTMDPSLAFVDVRDGHLIGQLRLAAGLHQLSIRHMVVDAQNRVWFGCQFRGDKTDRPQLIGYATLDGEIKLIELPPDALGSLGNYVGGLAMSADLNTIAASSPVGGAILTLDVSSAKPSGVTLLAHTCGAAPDATGFLATNGAGDLLGLDGSPAAPQHFDFQFDEHLRQLRT
ncbi:MAG TPA: DUF1513 domain-containing protein [Reyranella sp.]|jgi:hypothetical protein